MVAAKLATMTQGERTEIPSIEGRSEFKSQAASLLNVSVPSVERAASVHRQYDPELIHAVEAGNWRCNFASP